MVSQSLAWEQSFATNGDGAQGGTEQDLRPRIKSTPTPTSSLFRMHFLTRMAHRFVFAFHFFVFPFFMTTLLQLDVFSPK